jgi:hypothetical protein
MNPFYPAVARRAGHRCEYCRAPEAVANSLFEVEHIIPVTQRGLNEVENLALACRSCNLRKRDQTTWIDATSGQPVALFNPRTDRWEDHFQIDTDEGFILGVTACGRATVALLDMDHPQQVVARLLWIELGLFP